MLAIYLIFYSLFTVILMCFSAAASVCGRKALVFSKEKLILFLGIAWKFIIKYGLLISFAVPVSLLLMKANWIKNSGNDIYAEIIGPAQLSKTGHDFLGKFPKFRQELGKYCTVEDICINAHGLAAEAVADLASYATLSGPYVERKAWMEAHDFTMTPEAAFRGRYLHHYSVVAAPYRLMKEGHLEAGITSQYGLAAVLPLFVAPGLDVQYYAVISLLIQAVLTVFLARYLWKRDRTAALSFLVVAVIQALAVNQGAMKISPGFEIYRLLPQVALGCLFLMKERYSKGWLAALACLAALMNSNQFNVLFLLVALGTQGIRLLQFAPNLQAALSARSFVLIGTVSAVVALQMSLYVWTANAFTPPLFGSAEEGAPFHPEFALLFTLLPAVFFAATALAHARDSRAAGPVLQAMAGRVRDYFPDSVVFSILCYGLFATYCIGFYGSPQHFASFVLFSSPAIIFLASRTMKKSAILGAVALLALATPALPLSYFTLPKRENVTTNTLFDKTQFGTAFKYWTSIDMPELESEYRKLLESVGASDRNTYFISKDKLFIEEYRGHSLLPVSYDAFVNARSATITHIQRDFIDMKISHIVLDAPDFVKNFRDYMQYQNSIGFDVFEYNNYIKILDHVDELRAQKFMRLNVCSARYCVYDVLADELKGS